jgi:hypothetical protein
MPHTEERAMTREMQACIDECLRCYAACETTAHHCLMLGGKHADARHIATLRDCAVICGAAADFMLRNSDFHGRLCSVCAEICDACAKSCERIDAKDETMRQCIEACRSCAESCRRMAKMAA